MGDPVVTFIDGKTTVKIPVPFVEGVPQTLPESQIPQINDEAFEGWYHDNKYTEEWNSADLVDGHKTLYAKYTHSQSFVSSSYFPILILVILAVSALAVWQFAGRRA